MSYSITYSPHYFNDIRQAYQWYEKAQRGLGQQFMDGVDAAIASIGNSAESCSKVDNRTRVFILKPFAYGLYFDVDGNEVRVLAVIHLHRKPGLWRRRR
jgi:plasmid stabilization system protein ParE